MSEVDRNEMTRLWERVLEVEGLDETADFFELGGHSLLAGRLLEAVERDFGVAVPPSTLFDAATIAEFTDAVAAAGGHGVARRSGRL